MSHIPPEPYLRRPAWAGPRPQLVPAPAELTRFQPRPIRYNPADVAVTSFLNNTSNYNPADVAVTSFLNNTSNSETHGNAHESQQLSLWEEDLPGGPSDGASPDDQPL